MRILKVIFCLVTSLALVAGCSKKADQSANEIPADMPLPQKLEAAMKITNPESRDEALRRLSNEAAMQRQPDIAKQAIEKLSKPQLRDDVAAGVAKMFARLGDTESAGQLASMIASQEIKDRVLAEIARSIR